jgi:hypothetical protein
MKRHLRAIHIKVKEAILFQSVFIVVLLYFFIFLLYQFYLIQQKIPSTGFKPLSNHGEIDVIPKISPFTIPGIYHGVSRFIPHRYFSLQYPLFCTHRVDLLQCIGNDYDIDIVPMGTGHDAQDIRRDQVQLGRNVWNRVSYVYSGKKGASYGLETGGTYVLIEVVYTRYSDEGRNTVEQIISTFSLDSMR